jgi:hypothetical protein
MNSDNFDENINLIPNWDYMMESRSDEMQEIYDDVFRKIQFKNAQKLYDCWHEIGNCILAFSGQEFRQSLEVGARNYIDDIIENFQPIIFLIPVKICSASLTESYVLQMENAALIRQNVINIKTDLYGIGMFAKDTEDQVQVIYQMLNEFKEHFKTWVASFVKDDIQDDWGLFV